MGGEAKRIVERTGKEELPLEEGELLIRYLWTQGKGKNHEMRVMNTDAVSYQSKTS